MVERVHINQFGISPMLVEEVNGVLENGMGFVSGMPHIYNDGTYNSSVDIWANGAFTGVSMMRGARQSIRHSRGHCGSSGPRVYDYTYHLCSYVGYRFGRRMINTGEKVLSLRFNGIGELGSIGPGTCERSYGPKPSDVCRHELQSSFIKQIEPKWYLKSDRIGAKPSVRIAGSKEGAQFLLFINNSAKEKENERIAITNMALEYGESLIMEHEMEIAP